VVEPTYQLSFLPSYFVSSSFFPLICSDSTGRSDGSDHRPNSPSSLHDSQIPCNTSSIASPFSSPATPTRSLLRSAQEPGFPPAAIAAAAQDPLYVEFQPLVTVSPAQRLKSNLSNSRKLVLSMFRGVHLVSTVVHVAHR
jgi:hypothetical protein